MTYLVQHFGEQEKIKIINCLLIVMLISFLCVPRVVAMMSPEDSWVAKWQRIGKTTAICALNTSFVSTEMYNFLLTQSLLLTL